MNQALDCQEKKVSVAISENWLKVCVCVLSFTIDVFVCLWSRGVKVHARISVSWASEFQTVLRMPLV